MGKSKASLEIDGETFLQRATRTLIDGGCAEVVAIMPPEEALPTGGPVRAAPGPGGEQIDSLRAGLRALPRGTDAVVVMPVDHPLVRADTVRALIARFEGTGAPIVLPDHDGGHGHPVLFSAAVFDELLDENLPEGARTVVHAYVDELEEVAVDDPGIHADVDTPEDYERYVGGRP